MKIFSKHKRQPKLPEKLPVHIAIIMDGNGRWAKKRGIPRKAGHAAGSENFRTIATYCRDIGIKYLTVYAFSTENWKRSEQEVEDIMQLLENYLYEAIEKMEKDRISLRFFGDLSPLSPKLRELIETTQRINTQNASICVNVCLNYGGRDEIVRAARAFAARCEKGECSASSLTESDFSSYLFSAGIPDPDLVIRPSGEIRISNFLLWQAAYSEFYFTDTLWPDFGPRELDKALASFAGRERRYGGR